MLVALAAFAVNCALGGSAWADDAQDNQQLKEQMRIMMQQMQELQQQVQSLKQQQQQQQAQTPPVPPAAVGPPSKYASNTGAQVSEEKEPLLHQIIKGFYGTLDVSFDEMTKGMTGPAWGWNCTSPYTDSGCTHNPSPKIGAAGGTGPVGQVGSRIPRGDPNRQQRHRLHFSDRNAAGHYLISRSLHVVHAAVECGQGRHRLWR
jgi:hypothetical protein